MAWCTNDFSYHFFDSCGGSSCNRGVSRCWYVSVSCNGSSPELNLQCFGLFFFFKLNRTAQKSSLHLLTIFYHINCGVIQGFPAKRKAVTTHVKKYRIFLRVLI